MSLSEFDTESTWLGVRATNREALLRLLAAAYSTTEPTPGKPDVPVGEPTLLQVASAVLSADDDAEIAQLLAVMAAARAQADD